MRLSLLPSRRKISPLVVDLKTSTENVRKKYWHSPLQFAGIFGEGEGNKKRTLEKIQGEKTSHLLTTSVQDSPKIPSLPESCRPRCKQQCLVPSRCRLPGEQSRSLLLGSSNLAALALVTRTLP